MSDDRILYLDVVPMPWSRRIVPLLVAWAITMILTFALVAANAPAWIVYVVGAVVMVIFIPYCLGLRVRVR